MSLRHTLVRTARPYLERMPRVMATYRALRDRLPSRFGPPVDNPLGFKFSGFESMQRGTFEPDETAFLLEELPRSDVFVDIGANIGYFTCLARSRGVHTIGVEPHDANLQIAFRNLRSNEWTDGVEIFPVALADAPGALRLYGVSTGASLVPGWAGASELNARTVAVSTLDILLADRFAGKQLLIKIDVEGAELQVLEGATKTLARSPRPRWLVEVCLTENQKGVNSHFLAVFERFWTAGYEAFSIPERRVVRRDDVETWVRTGERTFGTYNFLFLPG